MNHQEHGAVAPVLEVVAGEGRQELALLRYFDHRLLRGPRWAHLRHRRLRHFTFVYQPAPELLQRSVPVGSRGGRLAGVYVGDERLDVFTPTAVGIPAVVRYAANCHARFGVAGPKIGPVRVKVAT